MVTKRVSVDGVRYALGSEFGYKKLCRTKGVAFLQDTDGCQVVSFDSVVDGGTYTLGIPLEVLPPTSLGGTALPSAGKEAPQLTYPRKPPSSNEGKLEGLLHASDDTNAHMQCTSNPSAVALLEILENTITDQQNDTLDEKFEIAANHVIHARERLTRRETPDDMASNEKFYTGAMANALNAVLSNGFCVSHQACLGSGSTHSDLSAMRVPKDNKAGPTTLMVGEGRWMCENLREETRGQLFNALLRHRFIDKQWKQPPKYGPILLMAFDTWTVEIDLAFQSTKGGKLEKDEVVNFSEDLELGRETFWKIPILRLSIEDKDKIAILLQFLAESLPKLDSLSGQSRVQCKIPMPLTSPDEIKAVAQYHGENVTIMEHVNGSKFVYKEYAYHLRQANSVMIPTFVIEESNQRHPPPRELLDQLGLPYSEWTVHKGPFCISVLRYPYIEGSSYNPTVSGWLDILQQIQRMHEIEYVHGDLLPRNVLFDNNGNGYVIDFDLCRKVGGRYVRGYNYFDFQDFRHDGAREGEEMTKDHDVHSLRKVSSFFFGVEDSELDALDLEALIGYFQNNQDLPVNAQSLETME